jgi:DNA gyrase/topoisomerase IV subunit A
VNAITIKEGDQLLEAKLTNGENDIMIAVKSGKAIRFPESKVRPMGRTASGVRGIWMDDDDEAIGMVCVEPTESEPKAEMDRFIATLIQIKRECEEAAASGEADNVVVNAPHTAAEICGEWSHPYTREKAAFPLEFIRESKFFPYVSKIDNGYGDRNLVCRCTE